MMDEEVDPRRCLFSTPTDKPAPRTHVENAKKTVLMSARRLNLSVPPKGIGNKEKGWKVRGTTDNDLEFLERLRGYVAIEIM